MFRSDNAVGTLLKGIAVYAPGIGRIRFVGADTDAVKAAEGLGLHVETALVNGAADVFILFHIHYLRMDVPGIPDRSSMPCWIEIIRKRLHFS